MSFTEETQFDGLLGSIIERAGGIEPFIDVIFSFLSRRTNFFTPTSENSHLPRDTILKSFDTYKKKALELEAERKKQEDQNINKKKTQTSRKPVSSQPKVELHPQVEDVDEGTPASKNDAIPVGNGGVTERYTWTQTLPLVDVYVKVPPGTTSRRCNIVIGHDHLHIEANNIVYLDGKLHDKVKPPECMWTLEDQTLIHVVLEKLDGMKWWNCVIQGDPQIDTQKIVPENSKLSDLDPELRQTVEKMMFDQEQKAKGLPSSDQLHQAELLEKFKKAHPEMDFSKAKICNSNSFGNGNFQF